MSAVEHPCILRPAEQLARSGMGFAADRRRYSGLVDGADFAEALLANPRIISVMLANNENGVVQDVAAWPTAPAGRRRLVPHRRGPGPGQAAPGFRTFNEAGVHALTVSPTRFYGPKGAAALVVDKRVELQP